MDLFNSAWPFLVVFAVALYAVGAVGVMVARSFRQQASGDHLEVTSPAVIEKKTELSGKVSVMLSGAALICGIILVIARLILQNDPDRLDFAPVMLLFPTMTLCAIGGVIVGSLHLKSIHTVWNFTGVTLGMIVLVSFSIWLLLPVITPP